MPAQPQASFAIQVLFNKHKTHKLVSLVKTYLKVMGKELRLWLGLGGRNTKQKKLRNTKQKKLAKQIEQTELLMGIPTFALFGFNHA